jgi:hypothetical protein
MQKIKENKIDYMITMTIYAITIAGSLYFINN